MEISSYVLCDLHWLRLFFRDYTASLQKSKRYSKDFIISGKEHGCDDFDLIFTRMAEIVAEENLTLLFGWSLTSPDMIVYPDFPMELIEHDLSGEYKVSIKSWSTDANYEESYSFNRWESLSGDYLVLIRRDQDRFYLRAIIGAEDFHLISFDEFENKNPNKKAIYISQLMEQFRCPKCINKS